MVKEEILEYKLDNLPYNFRKWKYLATYRSQWDFLPKTLKDRVAEQLMTADYIITLDEWLKPSITIKERQRVLLLQILASIYEGVVNYLVSEKIKKDISDNKALKIIYDKSSIYGEKRTFRPSLQLAFEMDLITESWNSKLDKIVEIRNWVHLSNLEKPEVLNWIMNRTCEDHRKEIDLFREYIKTKFD